MAAAEGESGAVRVCRSAAVDVVRVALLALRFRVGERALEVRIVVGAGLRFASLFCLLVATYAGRASCVRRRFCLGLDRSYLSWV